MQSLRLFLLKLTIPFPDIAGFFLRILHVDLCSLVLLYVIVKSSGSNQLLIEDSKQSDTTMDS